MSVSEPSASERELELGVGDDDAALERVLRRELVDGDGRVAYARGDVVAHDVRGLLEADGFVLVADGRLGRRREQRLRQLRRLPESGG